jgi:hypothetical protein
LSFESDLNDQERTRFKNAVQLEPTREKAKVNNFFYLLALNRPIAKNAEQHNCTIGNSASEETAQGLVAILYLAVGARVMLRANLWVEQSLVNGALGTVVDIIYSTSTHPITHLPVCIFIHFDNYSGPVFPGTRAVRIIPITKSWVTNGQRCSRCSFPLILTWSMTVHKCQGLELDTVKISIGTKEMSCHRVLLSSLSLACVGYKMFCSTTFPLPQTILYWTNERDQTKSG